MLPALHLSAMLLGMAMNELPGDIVLADTATKLGTRAGGTVIVTGSHGGHYAAYLTLKAHPRAVVHHDAGVGRDGAGIAVIGLAEALGVAAATVSHLSCRIADASDMMARGTVSHANALAQGLGVVPGADCRTASLCLRRARPSGRDPEPMAETRKMLTREGWRRSIILIDSASLTEPGDAGQIVVTGSHGALVGGQPELALKTDAFAAVFNDAGVGRDSAGISRLAALDERGIAGLAVSAASARIGDAASAYEEGIISFVNGTAERLGARAGEPLRSRLAIWVAHF